MSLVCSKCGAKNSEGARFCKRCGASLIAVPPVQAPNTGGGETGGQCSGCGVINNALAKFCRGCGILLDAPVNDDSTADLLPTEPIEVDPPDPVATKAVLPSTTLGASEPATSKATLANTPPVAVELPVPDAPKPDSLSTSCVGVESSTPESVRSSKPKAVLLGGALLLALGLSGGMIWRLGGGQSDNTPLNTDTVLASEPKVLGDARAPSGKPSSSDSQRRNEVTAASVDEASSASPVQESAVSAASADAGTSTENYLAVEERALQTQLRLKREERERAEALERQRANLALERQQAEQRRVDLARLRAEESAQKAAQLAAKNSQINPPAAVPSLTVESACAGSSNIVYREICRIKECYKDSFFSDPICVRFRKIEEANRQDRLYQ